VEGLDDVEFSTLEYVDWFNHRRLRRRTAKLSPWSWCTTTVLSVAP
jgi:transposase InsO family protein